MKYQSIDDQELVYLVSENNDDAKNILYEKYKYIIDIIYKKHLKQILAIGIDKNDMYQEALVGFSDGLASYKDNKNTALPTFLTLCVERRVISAIIKAGRIKNQIMIDSLSLEYDYGSDKSTLKEIISDNNDNNPLYNLMEDEVVSELENRIKESLSNNEIQVYTLMINNFSYLEIAKLLSKTPKSVDNTIQRIKLKVKKILNNSKNA